MNKSSAKLKIIAWSIVLVFILMVFVCASIFRGLSNFRPSFFPWSSTDNLSMVKEESISNDISNISIDWISGDVNIYKSDKKEIQIVQKSSKNINKKRLFSTSISGNTLKIRDEDNRNFSFFGNWSGYTTLDVYLPEKAYDSFEFSGASTDFNCDYLESSRLNLEAVSGNISINGSFKESRLESASGIIDGSNFSSDSLKIDIVSGKVDLSGSYKNINVQVMSGDVDIASKTMLDSFSSEVVSGKSTLSIPENDGFTLSVDKVSGDFNSDFPLLQSGNSYIYKDGSAHFSTEMMSGNFTLKMN
ncbi:MAG: DUF4097 family beta strand repeat-containing protein [Eubacteriaceae bacterium]